MLCQKQNGMFAVCCTPEANIYDTYIVTRVEFSCLRALSAPYDIHFTLISLAFLLWRELAAPRWWAHNMFIYTHRYGLCGDIHVAARRSFRKISDSLGVYYRVRSYISIRYFPLMYIRPRVVCIVIHSEKKSMKFIFINWYENSMFYLV